MAGRMKTSFNSLISPGPPALLHCGSAEGCQSSGRIPESCAAAGQVSASLHPLPGPTNRLAACCQRAANELGTEASNQEEEEVEDEEEEEDTGRLQQQQ